MKFSHVRFVSFRVLRQAVILALLGLLFSVPEAEAVSIAAFIPDVDSTPRTAAILKGDALLANDEIFIFSKYKDFLAAISAKDFDFIIAPDAIVRNNKDFSPVFQSFVDGKDNFSYILIGLDSKWQNGSVGEATVAAIEMLERQEMKDYLNDIFNKANFKRVKGISKVEDIFPIMAIGNADLAVVSPQMFKSMKSKFNSAPIEMKFSSPVKYFVIGRNIKRKDLNVEFSKLSKQALTALGASEIKKL